MEEHKELEISFCREMKQNYLMIAADEALEQGFEARMLAANTIDGLLKFRIRRKNDRFWFCYEITSRQPLARLLERKGITAPQIRQLLLGIAQTLAHMEDYLLSEQLILLDADYIYVNPDDFQPELCLLPGHQEDFPREFSGFLQFLLSRTDHQDKEAVVLIYGLYQESLKENYGLDNLMRWLMKEESPNLEYMENDEKSERIEELSDTDIGERGDIFLSSGARRQGSQRAERQGSVSQSAGYRRNPAVFLVIPVMALTALWLWKGVSGIIRYGFIVIGGSVLVAVIYAAGYLWKKRMHTDFSKEQKKESDDRRSRGEREEEETESIWRNRDIRPDHSFRKRPGVRDRPEKKKDYPDGNTSWEMVFAEDTGVASSFAAMPQPEALRFPSDPVPAEESMHTALLWSRPAQVEIRCLAGESGTEETIPIAYYPFLIGKQENLADYMLAHDTISRLHARIDRREDAYWLTDLNSTNGTAVNGHALQANETVRLSIGDQVELADLHFRFR